MTIQIQGQNDTNGSVISVYTDGSEAASAFRVYNGTNGKTIANITHDGNANFNVNTTDYSEGVQVIGNDTNASVISVFTDGSKAASAFRVYNGTNGETIASISHDGGARFNNKLEVHAEGTGQVDIWKGNNSDGGSTAVGWSALDETTGTNNTAFGSAACQKRTSGDDNTAVGAYALRGNFDSPSSNTGEKNTALGSSALYLHTTGNENTAVGNASLYKNTTASNNTAVGGYSLYNNETSKNLSAVGYSALYNQKSWDYSSALGAFAGRYDTSGNDSADFFDTTCIGYNSRASGHYQVVLGDTQAYTYTRGGAVHNLSDARDKTDVRDTIMGLDFIKSLRPVDYRWDYREDYLQFNPKTEEHNPIPKDGSKKRTRFHHGLIAQEVKSAADGLGVDFAGFQDHTITGGEERMTLGYSEFIGPLIKAVQELSAENEALKARLDAAGL